MLSPYIYVGLSDQKKFLFHEGIKNSSPAYINIVVSDVMGVSIEDMRSASRKDEVVKARQTAMYIIRMTNKRMSFKEIGKMFGGRDHSTVLHSCDIVQGYIDVDKKYRNLFDKIKQKL